MNYQVLARKWRPRFFDEMVGQEHVLRALINSLNNQQLHHAYLFTGTRGVGKTTIARILAKCLNCEEGISARPCGECGSCKEISEGRFVDLIEVDAASRTRVEDTRELLENVQYAPTRGRYKVYLIDEVHMLSTHSFNALLKTLEEPPAHVKFLLATTDPQKLPITVLSRCLQFNLKNMPAEKIVNYLHTILNAEKVQYEEPALWQLGRAAQGSMRDALSLTDQAIAYGEGFISEDNVHAMLGTMDRGRLFKIAEVMAKADASAVMAEIDSMAEHSPDYDEVIQGLLTIWHKVALGQVVPAAIDNSEGEREAILALAEAMQPEDVQLYYQIGVSGRADLALAPNARQGFEMLVLRMLAFRPVTEAPVDLDLTTALQKKKLIDQSQPSTAEPHSSVEASVENQASVEPVAEPTAPETPTVEDSVEKASTQADEPLTQPESISTIEQPTINNDNAQTQESTAIESKPETVEPISEAATQQAEQNDTALDNEDNNDNLESISQQIDEVFSEDASSQPVEPEIVTENTTEETQTAPEEAHEPVKIDLAPLSVDNWWQWVAALPLEGFTQSIASNLVLAKVENHDYYFDLHPDQSFLFNKSQQYDIEQALRLSISDANVIITIQEPTMESPAERDERLLADSRVLAQQALETDSLVQRIVQEFDGRVIEATVRPVS